MPEKFHFALFSSSAASNCFIKWARRKVAIAACVFTMVETVLVVAAGAELGKLRQVKLIYLRFLCYKHTKIIAFNSESGGYILIIRLLEEIGCKHNECFQTCF